MILEIVDLGLFVFLKKIMFLHAALLKVAIVHLKSHLVIRAWINFSKIRDMCVFSEFQCVAR